MQNGVRIVLTGKLISGFDRDDVAATLSKMFQVDKSEALSWLDHKETIVRRGVLSDEAERHLMILKRIGVEARFELEESNQLFGEKDDSYLTDFSKEVMHDHSRNLDGQMPDKCEILWDGEEMALEPDPPAPSEKPNKPAEFQKPYSQDQLDVASDGLRITETPPLLSFSMSGRIGRLRYIVYLGFGLMLFALAGVLSVLLFPGLVVSFNSTVLVFVILFVLLYFWYLLRVLYLRMHDINRSGSWLLLLWGAPVVIAGLVKSPELSFWSGFPLLVAIIALGLLPGDSFENEYGVPAGENSIFIKFAAFVSIALLILYFLGSYRYYVSANNSRGNDSSSSINSDLLLESARENRYLPVKVSHDLLLSNTSVDDSIFTFHFKSIGHAGSSLLNADYKTLAENQMINLICSNSHLVGFLKEGRQLGLTFEGSDGYLVFSRILTFYDCPAA